MTKIAENSDVFFNDFNNYVSYSGSQRLANELMSFKGLHNILRSKLGSYINMSKIDSTFELKIHVFNESFIETVNTSHCNYKQLSIRYN